MSVSSRTIWESFYRDLRRLECELSGTAESSAARRILRRLIEFGPEKEIDAVIEAKVAGFEPKFNQLRPEIIDLRKRYPKMADGRRPEDPLDDVYCAAVSMMWSSVWEPSSNLDQLYRGQRNHKWTVTPSLFRRHMDENVLEEKKNQVRDFARALQKQLPQLSDHQAIAVAQHYSAEAKLATWLIDVTWDPFIALFFASDGGQDGELGVVSYYTQAEWNRFSAEGKNPMGDIRVIDVPGIRRIAAQRALFIDTSHPDFFEQLVPFSIWFRQVEGITFEDETLEWPVSKETLYPPNDETKALVATLAVAPTDQSLSVQPRGDPTKPLTVNDYFDVVKSWLQEEHVQLTPQNYELLRTVCRFYYELPKRLPDVDVSLRSLHRLREAYDIIVKAERQRRRINLEKAVQFTLSRERAREVHDELRDLVRELEVEHDMSYRMQDEDTLDRLTGLIRDVGPLHTISGFGFGKSADPMRDLLAIKKSQLWAFVDLRHGDVAEQIEALDANWQERVLLIVAEGAPLRPLYLFVKGMIDKRKDFDLGDGVKRTRRADQSVVIVFPRAKSLQEVPKQFHQIPYWLF